MLNPCYVHGTTHVHGYVHACSCMFVHVKFWLPLTPYVMMVNMKNHPDSMYTGYNRECVSKP